MKKLILSLGLSLGLAHNAFAFDTFEIKSFDIVSDTAEKGGKAFKSLLAAQSKGVENSEFILQSKDEKENSLILKGSFTCYNSDQSKASELQASLEIKTKDKKIKFSFEKVIFGDNFNAIAKGANEDAKVTEAKKCVKPLINAFMKEVDKKDAW